MEGKCNCQICVRLQLHMQLSMYSAILILQIKKYIDLLPPRAPSNVIELARLREKSAAVCREETTGVHQGRKGKERELFPSTLWKRRAACHDLKRLQHQSAVFNHSAAAERRSWRLRVAPRFTSIYLMQLASFKESRRRRKEVVEAALGSQLASRCCWRRSRRRVGGEGGRTTPARFSGSSTGVKWNAGSLMRLATAADLDDCLSVCLAGMQKTVKRKWKRRREGETLCRAKNSSPGRLKFVYTDGVQESFGRYGGK